MHLLLFGLFNIYYNDQLCSDIIGNIVMYKRSSKTYLKTFFWVVCLLNMKLHPADAVFNFGRTQETSGKQQASLCPEAKSSVLCQEQAFLYKPHTPVCLWAAPAGWSGSPSGCLAPRWRLPPETKHQHNTTQGAWTLTVYHEWMFCIDQVSSWVQVLVLYVSYCNSDQIHRLHLNFSVAESHL